MKRALELAKMCDKDVPVGAIVVKNGEVIAKAYNQKEVLQDVTAHAEVLAIRQAQEKLGTFRLKDCEMFVTLEPCPMCAGALAWAQIGKVVYGASDPKRGYSMFSPSLLHPKTEVVSGVLADECGNMVTEFFRNKRK